MANAFALLSAGDDAPDVDVNALAAAAPVAKPAAPAPAATEEKGEAVACRPRAREPPAARTCRRASPPGATRPLRPLNLPWVQRCHRWAARRAPPPIQQAAGA